MATRTDKARYPSPLAKNLIYFSASLLVAVLLQKGGAFQAIIDSTMEFRLLGAFVSGLFFTSFLTTVPAIFALGNIALNSSLLLTALIGGAGAVLGDLVLFSVVRKEVPRNWISLAMYSHYCVEHAKVCEILPLFKRPFMRFLTPFVGAIIIASPLPDEIGLAMLGLSNIPPRLFIVISYVMNAGGIYLIGLTARALL